MTFEKMEVGMRKRSYEDFAEDTKGSPVDGSNAQDLTSKVDQSQEAKTPDSSQDWQLVERKSKKFKNQIDNANFPRSQQELRGSGKARDKRDTRPAITFAALHRINSALKISDLQSLVLYCLADGTSPQWLSIRHHGQVRKAVVLMVPGLERAMFTGEMNLEEPSLVDGPVDNSSNQRSGDTEPKGEPSPQLKRKPANTSKRPDDFLPMKLETESLPTVLKPLANLFSHLWPVKAPGDDKYYKLHSPLHAMLTTPIPKSEAQKQSEKRSKGANPVHPGSDWQNERTPITAFLMSKEDLLENEYVLHPAYLESDEEIAEYSIHRFASKTAEADGWRDSRVKRLDEGSVPESKIQQGSITSGRTLIAMDCEMCKVEGDEFALTKISLVDWSGETIVNEFVKPDKQITDYLTPFSGITPESLKGTSATLKDIQQRLLELLTPTTVLIGHSLDSDLKSLKMTHPFIVDTSVLFPHPRGPPLKSSLKWLAQKYLSREIQKGHGTRGHDSIEDARACLDLVKEKCERGPKWGSSDVTSEPIFKRLGRVSKPSVPNLPGDQKDGKRGAIVDHGTPEKGFGNTADFAIGCKDDEAIVAGVKRAVLGDSDGTMISGGGVDFTWARMRELEAFRGWSGETRFNKQSTTEQGSDSKPESLSTAVAKTVERIVSIREALPVCTLFVVYSGNGDPRELIRLQEVQRTFKREYAVKKWDQLSVKWTDTEEQAMKRACKQARDGVGFVCMT